jgi:hypothetical protein
VPPSHSSRKYETKIPITELLVMQLMLIPRVFSISSIKTFPSGAPDVLACGKTISTEEGLRWKTRCDRKWEDGGLIPVFSFGKSSVCKKKTVHCLLFIWV